MQQWVKTALVGLVVVAAPAGAGDEEAATLVVEHENAAQTLTLRTPED